MNSPKENDPIHAALEEFREAWFSGKPVDVEAFLAAHPECGPGLRGEVEGFLLVAEGLPRVDRGSPDGKPLGSELRGRKLGDFEIIREIGRGGMAAVFEARQISLNRKVALKLLPSHLSFSREAVRKFQREAEAGGRQRHPGIVAVHMVGEHEGQHYIAQELIEGGVTLEEKLKEFLSRGEQPQGYFRFVADFVMKVTDALHYAHESGVVHRDVKPSNLLITKDGEPMVTDFGLAKIEDALALSRTGDFSGTPYYMSPEQAASKRFGIDRRTDIFSLGVTLYEMITLKLPFDGATSQEIFKKILLTDPSDPHKANPKVPRDLSTICLKAMEKLPDKRYQTMEELSDDLNRFLHGDVILARLAGPGTRCWKRVKRNPAVSATMSAAIVAILALIGYVLWSYPQIRQERNIAEAEKARALEAEKVAEDRYNQIIRLSDVKRLSDLEAEAEVLWPAYPEIIPRLEDWIARAEELLVRFPEHHRTRASLREEASYDADRNTIFGDTETQWQYSLLDGLITDLQKLAEKEKGLLENVRDRLHFARTINERSLGDFRVLWDEAIESIADELDCPQYEGLVIEPIMGLVPIDRDPDSGLWEFAHLQTGKIPIRDMEGKLLLTEEMGLVFVLIPGGTFNMGAVKPSLENPLGSPNVDPMANQDEGPVHEVMLKPFLLSKYEMTQGQWFRSMGNNPSTYYPHSNYLPSMKPGGEAIAVTYLHPVEKVSWDDCVDVLRKLKLRLPSASEWEYAARAGTTTVWWTGNEKESLDGAANLSDSTFKKYSGKVILEFEDWLNDGYVIHAPVGSYLPNAYGLHDVHGNQWEWCRDSYDKPMASLIVVSDNIAIDSSDRVTRGGCWYGPAFYCRSTCRLLFERSSCSEFIGVRPAADLSEKP